MCVYVYMHKRTRRRVGLAGSMLELGELARRNDKIDDVVDRKTIKLKAPQMWIKQCPIQRGAHWVYTVQWLGTVPA